MRKPFTVRVSYQEYAEATEPLYPAPREFAFMTPLHGSEWA